MTTGRRLFAVDSSLPNQSHLNGRKWCHPLHTHARLKGALNVAPFEIQIIFISCKGTLCGGELLKTHQHRTLKHVGYSTHASRCVKQNLLQMIWPCHSSTSCLWFCRVTVKLTNRILTNLHSYCHLVYLVGREQVQRTGPGCLYSLQSPLVV